MKITIGSSKTVAATPKKWGPDHPLFKVKGQDLFKRTKDVNILTHPDVAKVRNKLGTAPLHFAARRFKEVLKHPEASKVKDKFGNTPLDLIKD